jgi:hypothetical protein
MLAVSDLDVSLAWQCRPSGSTIPVWLLWDNERRRVQAQSTRLSQFQQLYIGYDVHAPEILEQRDVWFFPQLFVTREDIVLLVEVLPSLVPCVLAILSQSDPRAPRIWTPKLLGRCFALEVALAVLVPLADIREGVATVEEAEETGDTFRRIAD